MELYLVQHGEAKPEAEDPERPLTDKGREEVELVGHYLAKAGIKVTQILHSGRLRAKQTAQLLAHYVSATSVKEEKGLGPLDDPRLAKQMVQGAEAPLIIVGHLPHLSRLASLLILGTPEREVVKFRMGGMVCLRKGNGDWLIDWVITPDLAVKL